MAPSMALGSPRPAVAPKQDGGQHRGRGNQAGMPLVDDAADQMPLGDVRGFVRHDAGEFVFVARRQDQAAVDGDEAAGHREGVDDGIAHDEVIELMLAFLGVAREAVADFLDVVADLGIFEDQPLCAHLARPHHARPGTPPRAIRPRSRDCPIPAGPARRRDRPAAQPTLTLAPTAQAAAKPSGISRASFSLP